MLTPQQLEDRKKGIGASDARYIVDGRWHELWLQKTSRAQPDDLSGVWAVQLGIQTEALNLRWYEHVTGNRVVRMGETVTLAPRLPFMRCTLDGFTIDPEPTVIEAKHVNGFSNIDDVVTRYTPQLQHQMLVCGANRSVLSVIIGSNPPILQAVDFDEFWAEDYLEKCKQFWQHVIDDRAPENGAPLIEPPAPGRLRNVDMSTDNEFVSNAKDWLDNKAANKKFDGAAKALKAKMLPDIGVASGGGVIITRSRDNKLFIKEKSE